MRQFGRRTGLARESFGGYIGPMRMRIKKFIGLWVLLAGLAVYALLVMSFAVRILPGAGPVAEFAFYLIAGMAWIFPTRYLIVWMNTPGPEDLRDDG